MTRPSLSPADRFKLIWEACDTLTASDVPMQAPQTLYGVLEAISDVASNSKPKGESVSLLREVVADWK